MENSQANELQVSERAYHSPTASQLFLSLRMPEQLFDRLVAPSMNVKHCITVNVCVRLKIHVLWLEDNWRRQKRCVFAILFFFFLGKSLWWSGYKYYSENRKINQTCLETSGPTFSVLQQNWQSCIIHFPPPFPPFEIVGSGGVWPFCRSNEIIFPWIVTFKHQPAIDVGSDICRAITRDHCIALQGSGL